MLEKRDFSQLSDKNPRALPLPGNWLARIARSRHQAYQLAACYDAIEIVHVHVVGSKRLGFVNYNDGGLEVHSSLLNVVLYDQPAINAREIVFPESATHRTQG
jgi:hypothetical protein